MSALALSNAGTPNCAAAASADAAVLVDTALRTKSCDAAMAGICTAVAQPGCATLAPMTPTPIFSILVSVGFPSIRHIFRSRTAERFSYRPMMSGLHGHAALFTCFSDNGPCELKILERDGPWIPGYDASVAAGT
jgi:hypothetical protein